VQQKILARGDVTAEDEIADSVFAQEESKEAAPGIESTDGRMITEPFYENPTQISKQAHSCAFLPSLIPRSCRKDVIPPAGTVAPMCRAIQSGGLDLLNRAIAQSRLRC
ncbi:hypothetical protein A2U01_0011355, partial [Trifolium medium]|nr:hypothetical protein [Trifolium medium]